MSRKRRLVSILAIAFVILAFAAWNARARIWMALFDRVVEANVGVDRSAALPNGLHVYVCGSGSPLADAERAGPCLAVLAGKDAFVFDSGSGSVRKLLRMGPSARTPLRLLLMPAAIRIRRGTRPRVCWLLTG